MSKKSKHYYCESITPLITPQDVNFSFALWFQSLCKLPIGVSAPVPPTDFNVSLTIHTSLDNRIQDGPVIDIINNFYVYYHTIKHMVRQNMFEVSYLVQGKDMEKFMHELQYIATYLYFELKYLKNYTDSQGFPREIKKSEWKVMSGDFIDHLMNRNWTI